MALEELVNVNIFLFEGWQVKLLAQYNSAVLRNQICTFPWIDAVYSHIHLCKAAPNLIKMEFCVIPLVVTLNFCIHNTKSCA